MNPEARKVMKEHGRKKGVLRYLDDFLFGPANVIDRIQGLIVQSTKERASRGQGHTITILRIDAGGSHTRKYCVEILRKYGVRTFGHTHTGDTLSFRVGKAKSVWAEYVLESHGVLLAHGNKVNKTPVDPAKGPPKPWADRGKEVKGSKKKGSRSGRGSHRKPRG